MDNIDRNGFRRLSSLFNQINTHLTFLASHSRATIPLYDLLFKLNLDITVLDLQCIKLLFPPSNIFFDYVDSHQLELSLVESLKTNQSGFIAHKTNMEDAYSTPTNTDSNQILVFDFKDAKIDGIQAVMKPGGAKRRRLGDFSYHNPKKTTDTNAKPQTSTSSRTQLFFLHSSTINVQCLTHDQLMNMIRGRNSKFQKLINEFCQDFALTELAFAELLDRAQNSLPSLPDLEDPIETLLKKKSVTPVSSHQPSLEDMVDALKSKPFYRNQILGEDYLTKVTKARYEPFLSNQIHPELREALIEYRCIDMESQLYTHQSEAIEALLDDTDGKKTHIIVSTSTGSGKSLIYQLPILNEILWDKSKLWPKRSSTAFFIFPTKALAQDQKRHLQDFLKYLPSLAKVHVDTYDGDTPKKERTHIRNSADIVFTNPDSLHASILPNYDLGWHDFLQGLKYVVMDEIHVYKGLFGIHVNYIMARLLRIAESKGNTNVKFVSCSATISNPEVHFRIICAIPDEDKVLHVSNDGCPTKDKRLLVWQPPPLMNKKGEVPEENSTSKFVPHESVISELAKILVQMLTLLPNIKILVFCPIRKVCEIMMKEIRALLKSGDFPNKTGLVPTDIMSYRGGYSKSDRRVIEEKMFNGKLRAIIATNALELGIDLSDLDVVITCGFPILKSNLHQQFGRAGRGRNSQGSLAIFVGGANPVDMYYTKNWRELIDREYEDLCVSSLIEMGSNSMALEMHLQCAAFEIPISIKGDLKWFSSKFSGPDLFVKICQKFLHKDIDGTYRTDPKYLPWPSEKVPIRNIEQTVYSVVDISNGRNTVIEEIEELRVPFTLYEGAIFLHQGFTYLVKEFNTDAHFATVERVNVDWITQHRDFTDVDPLQIDYVKQFHPPNADSPSDLPVFYGKIQRTLTLFGYFKVSRRGEILEAVEVDNPPIVMKSKGFWIDIPFLALDIIQEKKLNAAGGIHAAQHAIMNMLPLFISGGASTNPNAKFTSNIGDAELTTECKAPEKEFAQRQSKRKRPGRLIFYDSRGGEQGSGMSAKTFEYIDAIIYATYQRVSLCECDWGCPSCVTANFCSENSLVISKPAAIIVLAAVLGLDLEEIKGTVRDGPELNIPKISIETIERSTPITHFSPDVEILKFQRLKKKAAPVEVKVEVIPEKVDAVNTGDERKSSISSSSQEFNSSFLAEKDSVSHTETTAETKHIPKAEVSTTGETEVKVKIELG